MPPQVRITKKEIVDGALEIARKNGENAINARTIAAYLNCSTQPIFSNFASMAELQELVLLAAYDVYFEFLKNEAENTDIPRYKAYGMAYIRFAKQEKELFKLLFMRDRKGAEFTSTPDFEESVEIIMKANGISREKARLMHLEMWSCVHGIASMIATSFVSFDWELISAMLTDIYQGLRQRHLTEET